MSMDLFIARTMTTKASLVFRGSIDITQSQVKFLITFVESGSFDDHFTHRFSAIDA